jgi:hypothetical protein
MPAASRAASRSATPTSNFPGCIGEQPYKGQRHDFRLDHLGALKTGFVGHHWGGGNEGSARGPLDVVHPQLYLRMSSELEWRRRDIDGLEREIQETRAELRAIKSSKAWRFYQSLRRMVAGARRVSSR